MNYERWLKRMNSLSLSLSLLRAKTMNPEAFIVQGTSLWYNLIVFRLFKKAKTIESTILFAKKNTSN